MRRTARWPLWMLVGASCVFVDADPVGLGSECLFNGDCQSPLVCAGRHCRAPCRDDRDCVNGWRCRASGVGSQRVCLAPDELGYCALDSDCEPRVCGAAGVCVDQCSIDADCRRYSASASLRCVSLSLVEGGAAGVCENHPWLRDAGALDATADAVTDAPGDARDASEASADVVSPIDTPRVDAGDGGATGCPTEGDGACTPGEACPLAGVAMNMNAACAWFSDGSVRCWNSRVSSSVATGSTRTYCARPTVRFGPGNAVELTLGSAHACARTADGLARCWGSGLLGDGTTRAESGLVTAEVYPDEGPLTGVSLIASTLGQGTCAVAGASRRAFCWGDNGLLGTGASGTTAGRSRATENLSLDGIEALTLGGSHACALRAGEVWCFGPMSESTGDSDAGYLTAARRVALPMPAIAVSAGGHHTCALLADHTVTCFGQVWMSGDSYETTATPTPVAGLTSVEEIVGLWNGSNCARRTDGTVWCWGEAITLGDGSTSSRAAPAMVPSLTGVRRLFGRYESVCAWRGGADLWCWGENPGVASVSRSSRPVQVRWSDAP